MSAPNAPEGAGPRSPSPWILVYRVPGRVRWVWWIVFPLANAAHIVASLCAPAALALWVGLMQPVTDALAWFVIGIGQVTDGMRALGRAQEAPAVVNGIALDWVLLIICVCWGAARITSEFRKNGSTLARQIDDAFDARRRSNPGTAGLLLALPCSYFLVGTKFVTAGRYGGSPYYGEPGLVWGALYFPLVAELLCGQLTLILAERYLRVRTPSA
jgi:hypothetical protein